APASDSHWGTMFSFDNRSETEEFSIIFRGADENYLSTFDIDLIAGRNLIPSDTINEFLVNETLVHNLGFSAPEEVLGKSLSILAGDVKGQIVGVMSDFHDQSFKSGIEPVFITTAPELYNVYALKINMKDGSSALSAIRGTWAEMYPDEIFEYQFLDDQIASFYKTEETMKDGQFLPAYNVIQGTENQFIVNYTISQSSGEAHLLINHLKQLYARVGKLPENIVADAGFGSEENFHYLSDKSTAYLKYTGYYTEQTTKHKQD